MAPDSLRITHFGKLFDEKDVCGICGIGEGTKTEDLTAIGRFGIGFKAVYAFTDAPEVESGDECFAIDSFVWPRGIDSIRTSPGQTVFRLPFRKDDAHFDEIAESLQQLVRKRCSF